MSKGEPDLPFLRVCQNNGPQNIVGFLLVCLQTNPPKPPPQMLNGLVLPVGLEGKLGHVDPD